MNNKYSINDLIGEDELYHHGIKGQKWGVRRFQNKDGSLTPEGKKRNKADIRRDKMNKLKDNEKLSKKERKIAEYGSLSKKEQWNMAAEKANKTLQERMVKQTIEDLGTTWVNSQIAKNPDLGVSQMETKQRQSQSGQDYLKDYASLTYNEIRARASEVKKLDKKYNEDGVTYKQIRKEEKAQKKHQKKLEKAQREWDKNVEKNYMTAYNKAAEKSEAMAAELNKKYDKYDFSDLSDPKIAKVYDQYMKEYSTKWEALLEEEKRKMFGTRPK